mmetsp:Transcript_68440/g.120899  ORF Transcript_68440/g.120899 Transcript_68440/m.120899 type:complete len:183 (+) Transcript_68440:909-1457(+)
MRKRQPPQLQAPPRAECANVEFDLLGCSRTVGRKAAAFSLQSSCNRGRKPPGNSLSMSTPAATSVEQVLPAIFKVMRQVEPQDLQKSRCTEASATPASKPEHLDDGPAFSALLTAAEMVAGEASVGTSVAQAAPWARRQKEQWQMSQGRSRSIGTRKEAAPHLQEARSFKTSEGPSPLNMLT